MGPHLRKGDGVTEILVRGSVLTRKLANFMLRTALPVSTPALRPYPR